MAVHMRYKSLYISLPSSAKQQREITSSVLKYNLIFLLGVVVASLLLFLKFCITILQYSLTMIIALW